MKNNNLWEFFNKTKEKLLFFNKNHKTLLSIIVIIFFVLLSNFIYIFITNPDPLIGRSQLPTEGAERGSISLMFSGGNSIEPNDGYTKQALGVQAANQISEGNLPLWNHHEAVGSPLLGETQSAASFPFVLLLLLPNGFLIFQIVLQIIAGIGMYLFLRRLKDKQNKTINNLIAITGGCLFATIGTFMMLSNACCNPIAFLPWQMLGIKLIFEASSKFLSNKNISGMLMLIISFALGLNSGFPETAYINAILVLIYTIILFVKTDRSMKLKKIFSLLFSGIVVLLISLPWLLEFFTYINPHNGYSGGHTSGLTISGLPNEAVTYLSSFVPNSIGYNAGYNPTFDSIGGYFMISTVLLAIFAIFNKNLKLWHKILFGGWFVVGWLRIVSFPVITQLTSFIPMLDMAAVYRYIQPSMSFCIIILACLVLNQKINKKIYVFVSLVAAVFYGLVIYGSRDYIKQFLGSSPTNALLGSFFIELSIFTCIAVMLLILTSWKYKKQLICILLLLETLLCFSVWQLGAPSREARVNTNSIEFLQENLGNQRFNSNFIMPNYGSYFNISQIGINDLPVPALWCEYILENTRYGDRTNDCVTGTLSGDFNNLDYVMQDKKNGVKYFVVRKNTITKDIIKKSNLKLAYEDEYSQIYENTGYRKYISADGCEVIEEDGFNNFKVSCHEDSSLIRLELYYPGWNVKIDEVESQIEKEENLFQLVQIPKGEHNINFYYWPKYMTQAVILSLLGSIMMLIGILLAIFLYKKEKE